MAILHLTNDAQIEAYLDAHERDPAVLNHVRGCDECLAKLRAARRERLLMRAALESARASDDHLTSEAQSAYCDERLDDAATRATSDHLARCPVCLDHYIDLLDALALAPPPSPVGAGLPANGRTPTEAALIPDSPALVPTPGTFGTVFITRFADELKLTFVAAPRAIATFWERGSLPPSGRPGDPDFLGRPTSVRLDARAPDSRRAEVRSRSFTDVMRGLASQRREPVQPRPRPVVRIELPRVIASIELVDLHDGEVELAVNLLASRLRDRNVLQLTVLAPHRRAETVELARRRPFHLRPATTPITLAFENDDGEPLRIEVRSLVARAPAT